MPNKERTICYFGGARVKKSLSWCELHLMVCVVLPKDFGYLCTRILFDLFPLYRALKREKKSLSILVFILKRLRHLVNVVNREIELLHRLNSQLISDAITDGYTWYRCVGF